MMDFQEQVLSDLNIFFNDFAETCIIDGRPLRIIIDNDRLQERSKKEYDGISVGEILFFVKKEDFGEKPEPGSPLRLDNKQMCVFDCREDMGIYEIILTQNRGY